MELHALQPGHMLREYRIEKLLGEGGFGLTYLAFDTHLDKKVAIKEYMPSEHSVRKDDSQILAKNSASEKVYQWGLNAFLNEAKILAKFEDSNIVRIYRFFKDNGTAYIVMEYCEGGCLVDLISKNEHMPEQQLKDIVSSIVHGLQLVHNDGILHRDIKPDNIMFRDDGTAVLIDFGAARQAIGDKSRKVTTIITPGYAPLEQYSSKGEIGPWSDIYSLAAVAYLCLTGKKPPDIMNRLHDDSIKKLGEDPDSSPFLKSIDKALNLHVNDRPKSLSEWSEDWREFELPDLAQSEEKVKSKHNSNHLPIYAEKQSQKNDFRIPISARQSVEPEELTRVDYDSHRIKEKSNFSFFRFLTLFLVLSFLATAGYFGYDYYKKNNDTFPFFSKVNNKNPVKEMQQHDLVLKVQNQLNLLNYPVPNNGTLDTRTINSIKSFEEKKQLVVTGEADEILLDLLIKENKNNDDAAWLKAQNNNTKAAYELYLKQYPLGQYAKLVPQTLTSLQLNNQKQKEEKDKQLLQQKKSENQRLAQISKLKVELITNIQKELKRLKFKDISTDGQLNATTINAIKTYQKRNKNDINGLPTKTLLFQLKSEKKSPDRVKGKTFQDCSQCPIMVIVPEGDYMMGSTEGKSNEQPQHHVNINKFAIGQTEVTFKQWDVCYADGGCTYKPPDDGFDRNNSAVMRVNYYDAQQYINWLNQLTQKQYRLPSESEWEYAARADTTTKYHWGNFIGINHVNCQGCDTQETRANYVKAFEANAFGIYDMHGSVWEWVQDCWHSSYSGAPTDNETWEPIGCNKFVTRGGSAGSPAEDLRSANRGNMNADKRLNSLGFRVAVDNP